MAYADIYNYMWAGVKGFQNKKKYIYINYNGDFFFVTEHYYVFKWRKNSKGRGWGGVEYLTINSPPLWYYSR